VAALRGLFQHGFAYLLLLVRKAILQILMGVNHKRVRLCDDFHKVPNEAIRRDFVLIKLEGQKKSSAYIRRKSKDGHQKLFVIH
jgi:hypothetical protein